MHPLLRGLAAVAAVTAFFLILPTPAPVADAAESTALLFDDVKLFDGDRFVASADVLVRDGLVVEVGPELAPPENAEVVAGAGHTLLPGLIDAHTHTWGDALGKTVRFGVTTSLDHFTDVGWAAARRAEQADGTARDRADLFSAGTLVTAPGGHGTQYGIEIPTLERPEDADAFVEARLDEGADWIKLVIEDGGGRIPTMSHETAAAVVRAAKAREALVVAHAPRADDLLTLADTGIDGFVHGVWDRRLEPAELERLAELGVFVVGTVALNDPLEDREPLLEHPTIAALLSGADGANVRTAAPWTGNGSEEIVRANLAAMAAAGIPVLAGSDAPNPGTAHGATLHREIELMALAGLTSAEALAAATSASADAFRLDDRGRIAPGRRADLVLVEGDAEADVLATRDLVGVWKDGAPISLEPPAAAPAAEIADDGVVADFEDGLETTTGAGWTPTTDQMFGGSSTVDLEVAGEDGARALVVRGEVKAGSQWPWAGAMLFLGPAPMAPVDLSARSTLEVRVRGDLGGIAVLVFVEGSAMPQRKPLPVTGEWATHRIDLAEVGGSATAITGIGFTAGPATGAFTFELDDLRLLAGAEQDGA